MSEIINGIKFSEKEVLDAIALNNSFAETGKRYKKVYGIDGIEKNQPEINRLLSEGWEIASQDRDRILLGCNNVVNTYFGEDGLLRFEYGSNL